MMKDLAKSVIKFLEFNEYKVLEWKWSVSSNEAFLKAEEEHNEFNKTQPINSDFEKALKSKFKEDKKK
jgi:hypothetical protein